MRRIESRGSCQICPPPNPQFKCVNPSDVQPYFQMAEQYAFGDRMFPTNQGPSFPAHQFIISETSAPSATRRFFVAENSAGNLDAFSLSGSIAPPTAFVGLVGPTGTENQTMYPCTDHPTLTDELNENSIDWRYYTPSAGMIWTGPNAIEHMCGPNAPPPYATACVGSDWKNHVVLYTRYSPAPILTDISDSRLPAVSWVQVTSTDSEYP